MKRTIHAGATVGVGVLTVSSEHAEGARSFLVIGHGPVAPSREDWSAVCAAIESEHASASGQLVLSRGGVPDAAQRRTALAVLPPGFVAPPVAVVAEQAVVRGVITVLNWFLQGSHAAFKRSDVAGIARHLGVARAAVEELSSFADELAPR